MFFIKALGVSLLIHLLVLISVMNIDLPKASSQADFEAWVKEISPTPRRATFLPVKTAQKTSPTGSATGATAVAVSGAPRHKTLRSSAVLGLIGVASERGGDLGKVFSAEASKMGGDLAAVMDGKKPAEMPGNSNSLRPAFKSSGSTGPADLGGIVSASSGKVESGHHKEVEIPAPRVMASAAKVVTGSVEQQSVLGVIMRKNSSFTRCYERALKSNSSLAGKLGYEISVGEEGQVIDVKFIEDMLRSHEVTDCVKAVLLHLVFPKPKGGPAIFSSVLVFGTA